MKYDIGLSRKAKQYPQLLKEGIKILRELNKGKISLYDAQLSFYAINHGVKYH